MKSLAALVVLALLAAGALWLLSAPSQLDAAVAAGMDQPGDAKAGRDRVLDRGLLVLPRQAGRAARARRRGGAEDAVRADPRRPTSRPIPKTGSANGSPQDFARAIYDGVDDEGAHLYPAFPYPSYRHMAVADVRDLWAYLRSLAARKGRSAAAGLRLSVQHPPRRRPVEAALSRPRRAAAERRRRGYGRIRALSRRGRRPLRRVPHAARRARRR